MRLKKLTLFGFKSFPNRTKIKFKQGVCAIVGPNGCGKSNVVDAIRWVLGEQSARMLRARNMNQVIFSGSNGRDVNFAEVSLLLENTAGMAPPEFEHLAEIEIKRSVTRNGDTRYLINGKNCRLKDIHYLLMDTGAGTRAYSIVDQGQITQFVEMNPQERRHIIEEVAGISRYKARRAEAERRMDDTGHNLQRLDDLISEVDRQLNRTSRQAARARRYMDIRAQQDLYDKALLKYAWDEQSQQFKQLEKDISLEQDRLTAIQAGISMAKAEKEQINTKLLEKNSEIKTIKTGLLAAEKLLEELKEQMADSEKSVFKTRISLETTEKNIVQSEKKAGGAEGRTSQLLETIKKILEQKQILEAEERDSAQYVKDAMFHVEHVRKELEEVKIKLVDAAAKEARIDSERRGLKERSKRLETRIKKRKEEGSSLKDRISTLSTELTSAKSQYQELKKTMEHLSSRQAQTRREIGDADIMLDGVNKRRMDIENWLAATATKLATLKDIDASDAGMPQELRELIRNDKNVMGFLADFIEVEAGWERIFETALGNRLHALLVDSMDTCLRLAGYYKKNYTGTLRMIVADHTKKKQNNDGSYDRLPLPPPHFQYQTDMEPLWGHITCASAAAPAIRCILSDMVTCKNLDESIKSRSSDTPLADAADNQCKMPAMVTPHGEIVTPWLEINIQGEGDKSGVLVRRAMIKKLYEEKTRAEKQLRGINIRKDVLLVAKQKKSGLLNKISANLLEADSKFTNISRNIDSIKIRIESAASRKKVMDFEIKEARDELLDVELTLEERETDLEKTAALNQELSESLKGRERALRQQEGVLERRRGKHQEIQMLLVRTESTLKEREREKQHIEQQKQRIKKAVTSLVMEKKRLASTMKEQEYAFSQITAKVDAQEKAVTQARSRASSLEQERDKVLHELSEYEERIDGQQKILRRQDKEISHLRVTLSETRQSLQFIKQSCLERHNMHPSAIDGVDSVLESMDVDAIKKKLGHIKQKIDRIGTVNIGAVDEHNQLKERRNFLDTQKQDLEKSMADLRKAIDKINRTCRSRFKEALDAVNQSLEQVFPLLFDGGSAGLKLERKDNILEAGVEYMINLPGKKIQHLNLLSGGEKTMAAMALLFAVYFIKPSPFCLLDEVDAPLDEANTVRFNRLLKKIAKESQIVIITHNQQVMDTADILYGVTMENRGVSKIVSVNLT